VPGVQLVHPGRQTRSEITGRPTVGASPIPCPVWGETPRELTIDEIEELEEAFAQAARRAVEVGAEVIELHAAHGYILCQFLSPLANERRDRYGGSLENRARFALNALDKARDLVGADPVLGFRISADEFIEGGLSIGESRALAKMMVEHSSDFIHVSAGTPASGDRRHEEMAAGNYVRLAGEIKEEVDVPVICVGWATGLDRAEEILTQGTADLVAIGRALVADHDLLKKYRSDRVGDVVECIHCGTCLESLFANEPMICTQNPDV
jgi:2,4-dienoyl-CoA reductase-like NADH-dependent reductase (Old Yellow Enzyme family)